MDDSRTPVPFRLPRTDLVRRLRAMWCTGKLAADNGTTIDRTLIAVSVLSLLAAGAAYFGFL